MYTEGIQIVCGKSAVVCCDEKVQKSYATTDSTRKYRPCKPYLQ